MNGRSKHQLHDNTFGTLILLCADIDTVERKYKGLHYHFKLSLSYKHYRSHRLDTYILSRGLFRRCKYHIKY